MARWARACPLLRTGRDRRSPGKLIDGKLNFPIMSNLNFMSRSIHRAPRPRILRRAIMLALLLTVLAGASVSGFSQETVRFDFRNLAPGETLGEQFSTLGVH